MNIAAVVGALFTLVLAAVLVVGRLEQNANHRVARVPVLIEHIQAGTRSRKTEGAEHIL